MKRDLRLVLGTLGLLAGCSCGQPGGVDAGADVATPEDAPGNDGSIDAAPDGGPDAWAADAWIPARLILREVDLRPCDPITPQPHRPRALPADPRPRVLWVRSYEEIGLLGQLTFYAGSADRAGNLTFETQGIRKAVGEIDSSGALRGEGMAFRVVDEIGGPTMSLVDGRSAQFYRAHIRVDSDPPNLEATRTLYSVQIPS